MNGYEQALKTLIRILAEAASDEREACAKLAEQHSDTEGFDSSTARSIAERIRARSAAEKPPPGV